MKVGKSAIVGMGLVLVLAAVVSAVLYLARREKAAVRPQGPKKAPDNGARLQVRGVDGHPSERVANEATGGKDAPGGDAGEDRDAIQAKESKPEEQDEEELPHAVTRAIDQLRKIFVEDDSPGRYKGILCELARAGVDVRFNSGDEDDIPGSRYLGVVFQLRGVPGDPGFADPSTLDAFGTLLRTLPDVTDVTLAMTNAGDRELEKLGGLTSLTGLILNRTSVTDAGLANLATLTQLTGLSLYDNPQITDAGVASLEGLTRMESLSLGGTRLTDVGLASLRGMTALEALDLGGTIITDAGMAHLAPMTALEALDLGGTIITDGGMAHLVRMTRLYDLNLAGTKITDAGLKSLEGMRSLNHLRLDCTNVTDAGLSQLCDLPLESLWLDGTGITDAGLVHFEECWPELTSLTFIDTKVTKAGVDQLRREVPRLRDQVSPSETTIRMQVGSTMAQNPATIEPATAEQISRLSEVLWWLPVRSHCVFVSHGPFDRLFGRQTAGDDRAFEVVNTITIFNFYMRPRNVASEGLERARLSLVVKACVGPNLCHICVFDGPVEDAFMASLPADRRAEETIAETNVVRLESDFTSAIGTFFTWTTLVAHPRPEVVLFANDTESLAEILKRMKSKQAQRALPEDLPEWKHIDPSARQWAMRHDTNAAWPFVGLAYSLQAGNVAKIIGLCREEVDADVARKWFPGVDSDFTGRHLEFRRPGADLIEISFTVCKKSALGDFFTYLFGRFSQDWPAPEAQHGEHDDDPSD